MDSSEESDGGIPNKKPCHEATPPKLKNKITGVQNYVKGNSCTLKVGNLPPTRFMTRTFSSLIEKHRMRHNIFPDVATAVVSIDETTAVQGYVIVTFSSPEIAEAMCSLTTVIYLKHQLSFTRYDCCNITTLEGSPLPLFHSTPKATNDDKSLAEGIKNLSPFKPNKQIQLSRAQEWVEGQHFSTQPPNFTVRVSNVDGPFFEEQTLPSCKVLVSNLHAPFYKDQFLSFVERCLYMKCCGVEDADCTFKLGTYQEETKSLVIEFECPEVASAFQAGVNGTEYMLSELEIKLLPGEIVCKEQTLPACKVLVSNLHAPFYKDQFSSFVERCLHMKCCGVEDANCTFKLGTYQEETKSLVIEFECPEVASAFQEGVNGTEYMLSELEIKLLPGEVVCKEQTLPACKVLVSNLHAPFYKDQFLSFVERCLYMKCCGVEDADCTFKLGTYQEETKSLVIEFECPEVASAFQEGVNGTEYMLSKLEIKLLPREVVKEQTLPACKVLVSNLEAPFYKDQFSSFVERCLHMKCCGVEDADCTFKLGTYQEETKSLVIEFECPEVASAFQAGVNGTEYMLSELEIKLLPGEVVSKEQTLPACNVLVSNLHAPFYEDQFSSFVIKCLALKCTGIEGENFSFHLCTYNKEKKSLVIEFESTVVASAFQVYVNGADYMLRTLDLKLLPGDKVKQQKKMSFREKPTLNEESHEDSYLGPLGVVSLDEEIFAEEGEIILDSDEGKQIFHDALLKTRGLFVTKKNHDTGYVQILTYLNTKKVVGATITKLRQMRRNLSNCFANHKKNSNLAWPNYKLCEIIFDNVPVDDESSIKFGDALLAVEPSVATKILTKGAVFTNVARTNLIRILTDNVDAYRQGQLRFWENVSSLMSADELHYSPNDCKAEFKELERKLKDIEDARKKTGAPNKNLIFQWKHYDAMKAFAEADVAFEPPLVACAGSSFKTEEKSYNPLRKPMKKGAALQGILSEMVRSNNLKQQFLEKK